MTIDDWLAGACADADRWGLPDLKPLLASLADSTRVLRRGAWGEAGQPGRPLAAGRAAGAEDPQRPAGGKGDGTPGEEARR
jgi:hypothetical protein